MIDYIYAILWPANPNAGGKDMLPEEGDVNINKMFLERHGAVYWDVSKKIKEDLIGPFDGYIYVTRLGKVQYKCKIEWVIGIETLRKKIKEEDEFIPSFRRQCFYGKETDGTPHPPSKTWIKISAIEKLPSPLNRNTLMKLKDGKPVENSRSIVYIKCP